MWGNLLTGEATVNIVNCLKLNNTLARLELSLCHEDIKKRISYFQEIINKNRKSQGCKVELMINC